MSYLSSIYWIFWRDMKRYWRSKIGIAVRLIQPIVWLAFVGNIFSSTAVLLESVGFLGSYLDYLTPGIIIMTVLFTSIFGGFGTLWDRRLGYMNKVLATPISRSSIALGSVFAISFISIIQSLTIVGLSLFLGFQLRTGIIGLLGIVVISMILSLGFGSISIVIGVKSKTIEAFWGIVNFIGLPLLFVSSALYPTELMPNWLASISNLNPLSYAIYLIRLATSGFSYEPFMMLTSIIFLLLFAVVALAVASYVFTQEISRPL